MDAAFTPAGGRGILCACLRAASHPRPLTASHPRPLAASHPRPLTASHPRPPAASASRTFPVPPRIPRCGEYRAQGAVVHSDTYVQDDACGLEKIWVERGFGVDL